MGEDAGDKVKIKYDNLKRPIWTFAQGDTWKTLCPFDSRLEALNQRAPHGHINAAILVFEDLYTAQTMACSLFGEDWRAYILPIYDRIVAARDCCKGVDAEDEDDE